MLDTTLTTRYVPASNLKGEGVGANWIFTLPSLALGRVAVLGQPPMTTLASLARRAAEVLVMCGTARAAGKVRRAIEENHINNVRSMVFRRSAPLPIESRQVDLVVLADGPQSLRGDSWLREEVHRVLKPEGRIYFEIRRRNGSFEDRDATMAVGDLRTAPARWLAPFQGEMQAAVPEGDRQTIDYFRSRGFDRPAAGSGLWARVARLLGPRRPPQSFDGRFGVLAGPVSADPPDRPPEYLTAIAVRAGIEIGRCRWGLYAPGPYRSRKVLVFLFEPDRPVPHMVVKLTRDAALNSRLENEYRSLQLLQQHRIGGPGTVPQPVFLGHHEGLAVVCETMIHGQPFERRSAGTPDCRCAGRVIDRLTDLAAATADVSAASPEQIARGLDGLLSQYAAVYRATRRERDFLERQLHAIAVCGDSLPLVFQHGDPGRWNLLVTAEDEVALLDWESAEPQGMPLWDLLYFLRSYLVFASKRRWPGGSLRCVAEHLLHESPLGMLVRKAVADYCDRVNVPRELIEPLFYTCWMHRALKEATRLPVRRLSGGHYAGLLRLCIHQRRAPALCRLFEASAGGRETRGPEGRCPDAAGITF